MKYKIGYVPGTFDLFHVGHLNIIKRAKEMCDFLICTVSTDELVKQHKGKDPVVPHNERMEIVQAIKYVDKVVPQYNQDKFLQWKEHQYNAIFAGDDLEGTFKWNGYEAQLKPQGVMFVYFKYTQTTSSTLILKKLSE